VTAIRRGQGPSPPVSAAAAVRVEERRVCRGAIGIARRLDAPSPRCRTRRVSRRAEIGPLRPRSPIVVTALQAAFRTSTASDMMARACRLTAAERAHEEPPSGQNASLGGGDPTAGPQLLREIAPAIPIAPVQYSERRLPRRVDDGSRCVTSAGRRKLCVRGAQWACALIRSRYQRPLSLMMRCWVR